MVVVETIGRIRREHFIYGKSIKEIERELRLSRNSVRKVLRSHETSLFISVRCSRARSSEDGRSNSISCWR